MKRLCLLLAYLSCSLVAMGEYLNWQLSSEIMSSDSYLKGMSFTAKPSEGMMEGAAIAVVRYGTDTANLGSWTIAQNASMVDIATASGLSLSDIGDAQWFAEGGLELGEENQASVDLSAIADHENMSYYIEVYRYNTAGYYEGVARSDYQTYAQLKGANYISTGNTLDPSFDYEIWQGSGYSIPEPTSAMLLMIGLSLVGLKRKRA